MSIIVNNVVKFYGKQKALDDVSFTIDKGKIVGFLGPNGAGKSTMMKIITGFISKTSGEVLVNDMNIDEKSIEVRKIIGYLPENNPLNLEMYVREYLLFVAGIYKLGKSKAGKINEMIELTGLTPEQNKKIGKLSKGFRQRLGLAQALLHDPDVLILDEPTSGLDPNQIVEIRDLIQRVGKEKTVMLSTHIMQEVEAICDEVIIINQGKIVAKEKIENIHHVVQEKTQTIIVEFDKTISQDLLIKIKGVQKVVGVEKNKWLFEASSDTDIRPEIFNFAVKNGLTVLSQQKKEMSLEEVFQQLTK